MRSRMEPGSVTIAAHSVLTTPGQRSQPEQYNLVVGVHAVNRDADALFKLVKTTTGTKFGSLCGREST